MRSGPLDSWKAHRARQRQFKFLDVLGGPFSWPLPRLAPSAPPFQPSAWGLKSQTQSRRPCFVMIPRGPKAPLAMAAAICEISWAAAATSPVGQAAALQKLTIAAAASNYSLMLHDALAFSGTVQPVLTTSRAAAWAARPRRVPARRPSRPGHPAPCPAFISLSSLRISRINTGMPTQ